MRSRQEVQGHKARRRAPRVGRLHFSHRYATWGQPASGVEAPAAGNIGFDADKLRTFACPTDAMSGMTASGGSIFHPPGTALCHPFQPRCTRVCTPSCMASRWGYFIKSSALPCGRTNREHVFPFQALRLKFMIWKSTGHPVLLAVVVEHIESETVTRARQRPGLAILIRVRRMAACGPGASGTPSDPRTHPCSDACRSRSASVAA